MPRPWCKAQVLTRHGCFGEYLRRIGRDSGADAHVASLRGLPQAHGAALEERSAWAHGFRQRFAP